MLQGISMRPRGISRVQGVPGVLQRISGSFRRVKNSKGFQVLSEELQRRSSGIPGSFRGLHRHSGVP